MRDKGKTAIDKIREDKDVDRWFKDNARRRITTAEQYAWVLARFCDKQKLTPKDLIAMDSKERENLIADSIDNLISEGKANCTIANYLNPILSWLKWNRQELGRRIKLPNANEHPRADKVAIPSQDQLRTLLNVSDARERVAISLIAFSGVRPAVLGNYKGTDGLRFRDLPDVKIKDGSLEFEKIPAMVKISIQLSKNGRSYFTFLGGEGCDYLSALVQERKNQGENVTLDSPIITPRIHRINDFITTTNIGDIIRAPIRRAGLKIQPYTLRSYFASRAMLAESKGLTRDYRVFFMGHKGDIEHTYTMHKQQTQDTIEIMRKGYESALEYLETTRKDKKNDQIDTFITIMLKSRGYSDEDIQKMNLDGLTLEQKAELLKDTSKGSNGNGKTQKVVSSESLKTCLGEGWVYIGSLPSGEVVIETSQGQGKH